MTTIRQLIQSSPAKSSELFTKLLETSATAVKTREKLFGELKEELELLAKLEEQHLFPVLRKHKDLKELVREALNDNKTTRKLLTELDHMPKDSEEFATGIAELRKVFQQHVRDDKKELLPAILQALNDEEVAAVVDKIETEKAEIEEAKRAEISEQRATARQEREKAEELLAEQKESAARQQKAREAAQRAADSASETVSTAAVASEKVLQSAAESARRVVTTAPSSTGSLFWDAMFGLWTAPQGGSLARRVSSQPTAIQSAQEEEVIPLAEETLIVGKHSVTSGTTTVRRYVVEAPAEKQVTLYDEKVVVERRRPVTNAVTGEVLTELTVEMIETSEVPLVAKDIRIREEVVVRRERSKRIETVRDTVRRDEIEIRHADETERSSKKRAALSLNRK